MPDAPEALIENPAAAPAADPAAQPNAEGAAAAGAEASPSAQPEQAPRNEPPKWAVDRIAELVAKRKSAEDRAEAVRLENESLQRELQQLRGQPGAEGTPNGTGAPAPAAPSPAGDANLHPNIQKLAETMAENIARERLAQQSLADRVQTVEAAGQKEFGDEFDRSVRNLSMAGVGSPAFLEAVTAVPGAEKVLRYLGSGEHIEEAARIARLPPIQMGIELMRISGDAIKTYTKQVSAAPAPIAPLEGQGSSNDAEPDPNDTKAWMDWRNKTARRRYR